MITADSQRRTARPAELNELLRGRASPEDRALVLSFASLIFADLPDRIALGLSAQALSARIEQQFRFFAREMPSAIQLYKGLPGIHVRARNPDESEAAASGGGSIFPLETTIVETHTLDAPFILESLKNYFRKAGLQVFSAIGTVFTARRQWERIVWIGGPRDEGTAEAYCHFQIERIDSKERLHRIEHEIYSVLKCVITAVDDFQEMLRATREIGPRLKSRRGEPGDVESARAFLDWLLDDNYIFLGTVAYRTGLDGTPHRIQESATGVFTDASLLPVVFPGLMDEVESQISPTAGDFRIVDIDYCHNASAIYHLDPIDDIVVREWAPDGHLIQATLLLGRFAMGAFTQKAAEIPLLKEKQEWLLAASGDITNSHTYREIRAVFNRFPKRELFYANVAGLKEIIDRIVFISSDDEIAVFGRKGVGYEALYVAFSRSRSSYKVEEDLRGILAEAFGPISFSTSGDMAATALLVFYFDSSRLEHPIELSAVHHHVRDLVTTWEDRVVGTLTETFGERDGRALFRRYSECLSGLYREATPPREVAEDLARLEALEGRLEVRVLLRTAELVTLKLYSNRPLGLTLTLRTLQNLGLSVAEELRVPLTLPDSRQAFLYRFEVEAPPERIGALLSGKERFAKALRALDEEWATDDPLNGLILQAGLDWREVEVLRTLRNHLLQVRLHYNAETANGVFLRNSPVASALFRAFSARFDPALAGERETAIEEADKGVFRALEAVRSLAEDEVLRAIHNLIRASLRTNFYQRPERPVLAIKVDSRKVEGMVSPRPMCEIYVHSRRLEGIHLRGGRVARGGIRWSDRHDDFRTEILGLMKTQMVKNSIIVPVGAKGGFVLKGDVPSRPALDAYLVDRYREFVSGLLDVTDNIVDGKVLYPPNVVRHDGDDPYLVVAADKGTAHLSDTANSVSAQYGFWLGDAFASGGSHGYDHKKVGITARGVWECVKHHFRNLGLDVQTESFKACGIGDMAGDVFGNGMLQSRAMRLVAAFNHAHIFIDPDPDPERSYRERQRLFQLPRSSWRDYDTSLISAGGGVFDRSAKAIALSTQMGKLLDLEGGSPSGEEVIRRILTARVDLLYNGGVGTYVKAFTEDDAEVGDRANDRVRVDGREVRARVVAEGGNLGFTQKGREEYWTRGGFINTDAVDNSGGVDMSDHEVNIKILLDMLVKKKVIKGREERNRILAEMTEEVADLVLADNANQSRALTLDSLRSTQRCDDFVALIEDMVGAGVLNRSDDAIPTKDELLSVVSSKRGLARPLLAVLLGHAKMWSYEMLMQTTFPDSPAGHPFLEAYFPRRLEEFHPHLKEHVLRREIVATGAVNKLVNNGGVTFLSRTLADTKAEVGGVFQTYFDLDQRSGAGELRLKLHDLGLGAEAEHQALLELETALESLTCATLKGKAFDPREAIDPLRRRLKL